MYKKRVKYCAGWDTTENITKRLLQQFKTSEEDLSNIEFVHDDSYDIIVFNNYITETPKENSKSYIFFHEPTWSGSHQKNFEGYKNLTIFGYDETFYGHNSSFEELPSHTFYGGRGSWVDKETDWNYENIVNTDWSNKTKNISSIITNYNSDTYEVGQCTYKVRYDLVDRIKDKTEFVDFFGGWGNSRNLMTSPFKIDAVKEYKFCLAIENQFEKNWITEKFYDSILTDTIPIYHGCKNIKDIHPENGYIVLDDVYDTSYVEDFLKYINDNADSLYHQFLPELKKIKNNYFQKYNPLKKINNICR
jgi:hypothetical protein